MKLSTLFDALTGLCNNPPASGDPDIGSIHYRAQEVRPGGLFVAIAGLAADGHDFIDQALERGAAALVVQRPVSAPVPVVEVENSRKALAALAARFHGNPSEALTVIGITGTNGKTTTAYLVEGILAAAGFRPGVIGTIETRFAGRTQPNPMTTPESLDLQGILARMRDAGATHAVMEVSSHAVDLDRIHHCRIRLGVLTNLSQDHLDYHGTMERYWACKKRLFTDHLAPETGRPAAVVNTDDPRGRELAGELALPLIRAGASSSEDMGPVRIQGDRSGLRMELRSPAGPLTLASALVGAHNAQNILCAAGVGVALGLPVEAIESGIAAVDRVPGRLEPIPNDLDRFVYVDYAHTPDALDHALTVLRDLTRQRLICVFGCGGDRDRTKRPAMGEIAGRKADVSVITSDNPRSEPPMEIIADICRGMDRTAAARRTATEAAAAENGACHLVEPDRARAIALGARLMNPGDVLFIAGKGHEDYQILGRKKIHLDDREEALAALERQGKA